MRSKEKTNDKLKYFEKYGIKMKKKLYDKQVQGDKLLVSCVVIN